jgi:CYTH domain-containing protein
MGGLSPENIMKFQTYLMKMQMKMEDYFMELAVMSGEPAVVLCDRGVLDPYAYMSDECWHSILDEQGWSMVILRDRRYDAVIHLVTAADGAEEYYTLENNQARYESAETAIKVDRRTQLAWIGHPNFAIVDNTLKGFQNKLNKVLGAVSNFLKLDFSTKIFEKYLVEKFVLPEAIKREVFQVEESFLVAESDSTGKKRHKIRKRAQNKICSYMHSMRVFNESKNFHEVKKNITAREYMLLISKKDENLITTIKTRTSFIWENQSMMLDEFQNTAQKATVLKISVLEKGEKVRVPEFINIIKNITDDPTYSTYALAHKRD